MMQCLHFLVEPAKTFAFHVKESRNKAKDERAEPLVESQVFIMELAKDLHRVCQRSDVLEHIWTCEDVWPSTVCQAFILDCASLLDGSVGHVGGKLEVREQSETHPNSQEAGDGCEEEAAKLAILEWTRKLKKLPEDSVWPGQAVVEILGDIAVNWQKGLVPSLQAAVELLLWATLAKGLDKEAIPQKWLVWKQRTSDADAIPYIPMKVWNWIREAAVEVTLDVETANPDLVLSPDERKMRCGFERRDLINHPLRFDGWWCALGTESFSAGRRYWEVEVGDRDWRLGMAKASAFRKGFKSLNTASGYLTLRLERGQEMKALTVPFTALTPALGIPQRVGVYLDYEKGQLSFYDAKNRSHIYTYNETFTEELYPLFGTVEIINDLVIWSPGAPAPRCPGICVWG